MLCSGKGEIKMDKLAIDGGKPAFEKDELAKLVPAWPPVYPETDQKLLEVYHSGKWGLCGKYEQLLMQEFAAFLILFRASAEAPCGKFRQPVKGCADAVYRADK